MANIKPLGDRVLIEICENTEEMKGGILIPDTAKEKPQEFRVVALGTGKNDEKGGNTDRHRAKKCSEKTGLLVPDVGRRIDGNGARGALRNRHHVKKLVLVKIVLLFHKLALQ